MREREPAPQEHVDERDGRRPQRPDDALRLASQMGNVAFTALARSVARQSTGEVVEFPPDYIGPEYSEGGGQSQGGESDGGYIEFPPDHVGPEYDTGPKESDGYIEFPPDYIGPEYSEGIKESDGYIEFPPDYIGPES